MKIQLMDVRSQYEEVDKLVGDALSDIFKRCSFILGDNVRLLEDEIANYCGTKFGVGVASGTDALVLGLRALGVSNGDEVITTAYTFYATAEAIAAVGATPVFADIEEATMNIDPEKIEAAITPRTKAIMPVHIFGYPADMDKINSIAGKYGFVVIEDACQAIGAEYKGRKAGSLANGAAFSFFPTKNLSCAGDGGMFVTASEDIAEDVRMLRFHGSRDKKTFYKVGYNSRLDELQAAILRIKLNKLDEWNNNRRRVAKLLSEKLANYCKVPYEAEGSKHAYHLYVIRSPKRKKIQEVLKDKGVASAVYYGIPLHMQPVFENLGYGKDSLPITENAALEGLALPMHPYLSEEDAHEIASAVIKAVEE